MAGEARYEVLEVLGRGGMGTVHRALQRDLHRIVALKCLAFAGQPNREYLARFRQEALGMCRVSHPNLVRVFDTGELEGVPFIAMELVEGQTLEAMVRTRPADVRRRADALFAQIASGVAALHEAGMVHRDLKSSNVMVDADGRAVVMDFGLVKDLDGDGTQLTGTGAMIGTPRYMAPEVLDGEPAGFAADVWALGCLYFEMHAGRYLFDDTSLGPLMKKIASGEIPDLSVDCPGLRRERRVLLERLLARDPAVRPADAAQVRRMLEQPAALPVTSPPLSTRAWRWRALAVALVLLPALGFLVARGREPVRASVAATPEQAQSPRIGGDAAVSMLDAVIQRGLELKKQAKMSGVAMLVDPESRAGWVREYRRGVDGALDAFACVEPASAVYALAKLGAAVGFLLDSEYARLDPDTRKRLLARLEALAEDPEWCVPALVGLAAARHHASDHATEHARMLAAVERFEARHLTAPIDRSHAVVFTWYELLVGMTACNGSGRVARLSRARELHERMRPRIREIGTVPPAREQLESLLAEGQR